MSSTTWQTLARLFFLLAAVSLCGVGWTWWTCADQVAANLDTIYDLDDPSEVAARVALVRASYEAAAQEIPESVDERMGPARNACTKEFPVRDSLPFGFGSIILLLVAIMARMQSRQIQARDIEDRSMARQATRALPAVIAPEPKPLTDVTPVPLDVGIDLDFGAAPADSMDEDDDASLMAFVVERGREQQAKSEDQEFESTHLGGFFCPPGYEDKPAIYVDPASESARDDYEDDTPFNAPQSPFKTLDAAVKFASIRTVRDTPGVQIRIAPGIYQSSVVVPNRVALINQRMPIEGTVQQRLQWISELELGDPDRVTILPPSSAEFAVRFSVGTNQGIFGCHLIGREGVAQAGIVGSGAHKLAIFNCHIEGFQKGGVRLDQCGTEVPGNGTRIMACEILQNSAALGGGIYAMKSTLRVTSCLISHNHAHNGGGIWLSQMKSPAIVLDSRLSHNVARGTLPAGSVAEQPLRSWNDTQGTGGGLCAVATAIKITGCEFIENAANVGGGGVAVIGSKCILEAGEEHHVRLHRNKARSGGAVLVCGWQGAEATLKVTDADIQYNECAVVGGAIAAIGLTTVQVRDCEISHNQAQERRSLGGALGALNGAELMSKGVEYRGNRAVGSGGVFGAVNASVRISEGSDMRDNTAGHAGGAVYCITEENREMEGLIGYAGFKLPFVLVMSECVVSSNSADELGGGVRAGNLDSRPTFPLGIKIDATSRVRNNRTKHPNAAGDDLWIVWADQVVASTENRPGPKLLLK